jgi:hypothetical protein
MPGRTKEQRRLDSLARLLERGFTCAAVCSIDGKLFVATNHLVAGSGSVTKQKITDVVSAAQKEGDIDDSDRDLFEDLVWDNVKASSQGKLVFNESETKALAREFLSKEGLKEWEDMTIRQLKEVYKTPARTSDAVFIGSIAERLAVDFFKVKKEFSDNDQNKLLHKGLQVIVLPAEKDGVHAEMTILDKLIEINDENAFTTPVYIGISKKCCDRCTDVIEAVNDVLTTSFLEIDDSKEEAIENDEIDVEVEMIQVSGSHTQRQKDPTLNPKKKKYSGGWFKPSFLDKTTGTYAEIKGSYDDVIEDESYKYRSGRDCDMGMSRSPSPPPFIEPTQAGALQVANQSVSVGK